MGPQSLAIEVGASCLFTLHKPTTKRGGGAGTAAGKDKEKE